MIAVIVVVLKVLVVVFVVIVSLHALTKLPRVLHKHSNEVNSERERELVD